MKTRICLMLLVSGSILYSCEKDNENPATPAPPAQSRYDILTSHYWRTGNFNAVIISDVDGNSVMDTTHASGGPDSCSSDDRFYFQTNGTMLSNFGNIDCNSVNDTSTWSLVNSDTQLLIDSFYHDIINISSSQFTFRGTYYLFSPDMIIEHTQTFNYP